MPKLRPYADGDWEAVLDLCLRAFAPACESVERLLGTDVDWRTHIGRYLRSLTRPGKKGRLVVAELRGSAVGVVHYRVDRDTQSGSMGVSAVHPARQGKGIGSLMYRHVLDAMRAQGVKYVTADTSGDSFHAPARRAYENVGFMAVPTVHYFMRLQPAPSRGTRGSRARWRPSPPACHPRRSTQP